MVIAHWCHQDVTSRPQPGCRQIPGTIGQYCIHRTYSTTYLRTVYIYRHLVVTCSYSYSYCIHVYK